ncbi:MAG: hypothetical protein RDV48_21335 [Candidatus Eremiobacteraeota bacterium]|nr:hypothetical protein [Candidatus Eremiobacteraeota bacterium]
MMPGRRISFDKVYRRYGEGDKTVLGGITAKRGDQAVELPWSGEDIQLLSYYYCGSEPGSLKNPDTAEAIRKVYDSGNTFYDRYLAQCFQYKEGNPLYAYSNAVRLTRDRDPQSDLHFKDGEKFFQIESLGDFKRACVLSGAMKATELSPDEQKALPIISGMLKEGATFVERYGDSKVGPLAPA